MPAVGERTTLWLALPWVAAGVLLCVMFVPRTAPAGPGTLDRAARLRELARGATILAENRQILLAAVVRVICNLTLFGFSVIMPLYLSSTNGGGGAWSATTDWMRIWGVMFAVTLVTNVVWGRIGDRYGWMRQMRWYGCLGCAVATLGFYYLPQWFGANLALMMLTALLLGVAVSAFVPMGAVFPALAPSHRGAAISAHNLAAGVSTLMGPAIASLLLPLVGPGGVCWAYAALYLAGAVITVFIHPPTAGHRCRPPPPGGRHTYPRPCHSAELTPRTSTHSTTKEIP